ncbi:MAG TPA: ABC transporter permease [Verrucomicrobiae bacterium]|nr:ABC transporter permease [Verrucomicrobiae bacterium]
MNAESSNTRSFRLPKGWIDIGGRLIALLVVFVFFASMIPDGRFYGLRNLENLLRQSAVYGTAGLGMTLVIITAGIDLSVGSMIALSVVTVAWVLNIGAGAEAATVGGNEAAYFITQHPVLAPIAACAAAILIATLAGLVNGSLIVWMRLVPFIVTLGTMGVFRGLAKGIAHERDIYPPDAGWVGRIMDPVLTAKTGSWMLLPTGVWILIAGVVVTSFLLGYTRLGRHIYAVGSNEETAWLCGVKVGRVKLIVYSLCGFFCGLAGLMQFSYIGIGQPTTGDKYELFAIAAVIIGGASFNGGEGSAFGTLIGALTITVLYAGGQQMGWSKWVQEMVIGAIIIIAVALDRLRHLRWKSTN